MELLPFNKVLYTNDEKFTEMAQHAYSVLKNAMNLRDDLYIVVSTHSENIGDRINKYDKIKTLGK